MKRGSIILFAILAAMAVALFAIDMMVGSVGIDARDIWAALTGGECNPITRKIILDIRLIKALMAILAGAAL
jgi:iron complex transport system permease protein